MESLTYVSTCRRLKAMRLSCCPSVLGELSLAILPNAPGREKLYANAASVGIWNEETLDDDMMADDGMSELAPSAHPERTDDATMDEESTSGADKADDKNEDATKSGENAAADKKDKEPLTVQVLINRVTGPKAPKEAVPYIQLWLAVLSIFLTVDSTLKGRAAALPASQMQWALDLGVDAAIDCRTYVQATSRRSTDSLDAKAYFAMARIYNLAGRCQELRPYFLDEYRSATIDHKHMCQATLINQLVASYIDHNEHDLAVKFVQRANFPDDIRSTAQIVRNLFNLGRMQAVRLEYSDAHEKLVTAVRKLPPNENFARGFKLLATKHAIVVELLMGDVPEVSIFNQSGMEGQLSAYEGIVQAVRHGDLVAFGKVLQGYHDDFVQDGTLFLVERLHHSVIRAGLRRINNAYSRITLVSKLFLSLPTSSLSIFNRLTLLLN